MSKPSGSRVPSNIYELAVELADVRAASVMGTSRQLSGSSNEVWQCAARATDGEQLVLFVKPALDVQRTVTEVLCAQLARAMGIPCPEPFVVTVQPQFVRRPRGPPLVVFGSRQAGTGPVVAIRSVEKLLERVQAARLVEDLIIFDELIANAVRGPGDILLDPSDRSLLLIDHERAMDLSVPSSAAITNWIADRNLQPDLSLQERVALRDRVRARLPAAFRVKLDGLPQALHFDQNAPASYAAKLAYLRERRDHLVQLLDRRILPEQLLIEPHRP